MVFLFATVGGCLWPVYYSILRTQSPLEIMHPAHDLSETQHVIGIPQCHAPSISKMVMQRVPDEGMFKNVHLAKYFEDAKFASVLNRITTLGDCLLELEHVMH